MSKKPPKATTRVIHENGSAEPARQMDFVPGPELPVPELSEQPFDTTTADEIHPAEGYLMDVTITVPLAVELHGEHQQRHFDFVLEDRLAQTLRRLFNALDQVGARRENGNRVKNAPDALRWMLERMATAILPNRQP